MEQRVTGRDESESRLRLEDGFLLILLFVFTIALGLIVAPFFAAILWGVIAAILFMPVNRRLLAWMPNRPNGAALLTLLLIVAMVIVPSILLALALAREATDLYNLVQSGHINVPTLFRQVQAALPDWAEEPLRRLGLYDFEAVASRLEEMITSSFRTLATQAWMIGQGAFSFIMALGVMLYLTFFLLRDGEWLTHRVSEATPLRAAQRQALFDRLAVVIRATIKGSVVVAIIQGLIGGVIFWMLGISGAILWGVLMGAFSLLPAIGTGIVWVPVAIYLFATGAIVKGVLLVFAGLFIVGMVDNVLRPILVGRDTRMPDYVVLISTLGGLELFGFNGIVIGPMIAALFIAVWAIFTEERLKAGAEPAGDVTPP